MNDDIFTMTARLYTLVGKAAADPMMAYIMSKHPNDQAAQHAEIRAAVAALEAIAHDRARR
jgi:hypothetical protein